MNTAADEDFAAIHRRLGAVWDRLAAATDAHTRTVTLLDAADLHHQLSTVHDWFSTGPSPYDDGHPVAASCIASAQLLDALADVELVAAGSLSRRHATDTVFEAAAGAVLDRMASTADITARAAMLAELHAAVEPVVGVWAAELLPALPYAPGMTGWDHEEPLPRTVSWRAFLQVVRIVWRRRTVLR